MNTLQDTYKDTKIGRIPKDWVVVKLKDINEDSLLGGNYKNGEGEKGIPLIKMGNLGRGKIKLNKVQNIPETLVYDNIHILQEGDFLFNTRNTLELVGKVAIWRNELPKALYNSNLLKIVFNNSKVHSTKFMNYVFNSDLVIKKLRGLATGSTSVAAIYNKDLFKLNIPLPPLTEQQKIADILSTVDEQISTTDKIIEKSKELKKGLMQKLFSEGIQHTEFKDTKIGRIPKEWRNTKLKELVKINQGLQIAISKRLTKKEEGAYFYITNEFLRKSSKYSYYVKDPNPSVMCNEDDILMTRTGNTGQVVTGVTGVFHNNFFKIKYRTNLTNKDYLYYFLTLRKTNKRILSLAGTSTIPDLNHSDFYSIIMPVPSIQEQQKIAEILSEADAKIEREESQKEYLEKLKKGLMQQLLTGKKRVKV